MTIQAQAVKHEKRKRDERRNRVAIFIGNYRFHISVNEAQSLAEQLKKILTKKS